MVYSQGAGAGSSNFTRTQAAWVFDGFHVPPTVADSDGGSTKVNVFFGDMGWNVDVIQTTKNELESTRECLQLL